MEENKIQELLEEIIKKTNDLLEEKLQRIENNINTYVMGTFFQPNPKDCEKGNCLKTFENIISQISIKWDDISVLAGDFNINLFNQN